MSGQSRQSHSQCEAHSEREAHSDHGNHAGPGHHSHTPTGEKQLIVVLSITATVFIAEVVGALWSGSLALLTDAGHMLVDSSGLAIALLAAHLMKRPRSDSHTWGYRRSEILAAALQAGMLVVICGIATVEGFKRLILPDPPEAGIMLAFAAVGLVGNLVGVAVLFGLRGENLNLRAAFLEVSADALGSILVLVAASVQLLSDFGYADALASLAIAAIMAPRAIILLRSTVRILLAAAPEGLDLAEVRAHIVSVDHVLDCHDLHAVTIGTGLVSLTAHVTVEDECMRDGHAVEILHQLQTCVAEHFPISIEHSTFQLDTAEHSAHEPLRH